VANVTAFQRNTETEHYYNMPYIDYEMTCPWRHAGKRRKDAVIRRLLPTIISLALYSSINSVPQAWQSEECWQEQISGWSRIKSVLNCDSARHFGKSWFLHLAFPPKKEAMRCSETRPMQWHLRRSESSRYETPDSSRYMERWVDP